MAAAPGGGWPGRAWPSSRESAAPWPPQPRSDVVRTDESKDATAARVWVPPPPLLDSSSLPVCVVCFSAFGCLLPFLSVCISLVHTLWVGPTAQWKTETDLARLATGRLQPEFGSDWLIGHVRTARLLLVAYFILTQPMWLISIFVVLGDILSPPRLVFILRREYIYKPIYILYNTLIIYLVSYVERGFWTLIS